MRAARLYLGSAVVLVAAFVATLIFPVDQWVKNLLALPGVVALGGVVIQLWRDRLAHERAARLQDRQNDFAVATASHMAKVAYDSHVALCEEYMERVNAGIKMLFREGPHSDEVLQFAYDLADIRSRHVVWLTSDLDERLAKFERTLRLIGADDALLEHLGAGDERSAVVARLYNAFGKVTDMGTIVETADETDSDQQEEVQGRNQILTLLRSILGTEELTALRLRATEMALSRSQ